MPTFVTNRVVEPNLIGDQAVLTSLSSTDEFLVRRPDTNVLKKVNWANIQPAGTVLQTNYTQLVGNQSYTSGQTLAASTTAPSITDGVEILRINGVAVSSTSNYLIIDVSALISSSQGNITTGTVMLFAGNTLLASTLNTSGSNNAAFVRILFKHLPNDTSSVDYTVRAAVEGGTLYANRLYTVNDYNTGKQVSSMLIQEIKG